MDEDLLTSALLGASRRPLPSDKAAAGRRISGSTDATAQLLALAAEASLAARAGAGYHNRGAEALTPDIDAGPRAEALPPGVTDALLELTALGPPGTFAAAELLAADDHAFPPALLPTVLTGYLPHRPGSVPLALWAALGARGLWAGRAGGAPGKPPATPVARRLGFLAKTASESATTSPDRELAWAAFWIGVARHRNPNPTDTASASPTDLPGRTAALDLLRAALPHPGEAFAHALTPHLYVHRARPGVHRALRSRQLAEMPAEWPRERERLRTALARARETPGAPPTDDLHDLASAIELLPASADGERLARALLDADDRLSRRHPALARIVAALDAPDYARLCTHVRHSRSLGLLSDDFAYLAGLGPHPLGPDLSAELVREAAGGYFGPADTDGAGWHKYSAVDADPSLPLARALPLLARVRDGLAAVRAVPERPL